jgi:ABC-type glycerol-3-phosphate transport system substrate-binding protein
MTKFQIILTGIFGVLIVLGVIVFSAYKGSSQKAVSVTMWGTVPESSFTQIIAKTSLYQSKEFTVVYVQKSPDSFDDDLLEALASGQGPDIFMLPSNKLLKERNKVFAIPYNVFSQRQFRDAFVQGAEIYMFPEGTMALPISVDPLVMYWNRSIFTNANLTEPPKYWDEFNNLANVFSKKDGALNISRSAVAFGGFANIAHAKEIVLNLAMQAGTPITAWNGEKVQSIFASSNNRSVVPAEAAVNFYNQFSDPAKPTYSWNNALPNSTGFFLSGDLALYFGFGSEIAALQLKNPNLNFDVAPVPTERESGANLSYGNFNALAITKNSKNLNATFSVISILTGADAAKIWSDALKLPPVRRDLLAVRPTDAYQSVFWNSAIRSQTWLDPSPDETNVIIKDMIESVTSGRSRTGEAVSKVQNEIGSLLGQ